MLILIVGCLSHITITGGSNQHSAIVLFDLYVAASERSHLDVVSMLFKWRTLQFLIVVWNSLQHP